MPLTSDVKPFGLRQITLVPLPSGTAVALSAAEFRLLRCFMLNPGRVLSRGELEEHLYDGATERDSNVLEVYINRLRRKFGRDLIATRRGQGYILGAGEG